MDKIKSFQRNHNEIKPGLYQQEKRIIWCRTKDEGGNIYLETYDLRFVKPNTRVIPIKAMHTIEHLMASYLKSKYSFGVISFCPGACQTMFYLELLNYSENPWNVGTMIKMAIDWCLEQDTIPGATKEECGNYKSHDLEKAKYWLQKYKEVLDNNDNVFN